MIEHLLWLLCVHLLVDGLLMLLHGHGLQGNALRRGSLSAHRVTERGSMLPWLLELRLLELRLLKLRRWSHGHEVNRLLTADLW